MDNSAKIGGLVAGAVLLVVALVLTIPLLFISPASACTPGGGVGPGVETTGKLPARVGRWSGEQIRNAAAVINAGAALGVPARAQAIAVMTAMGESSLRVLDYGDAVGPDSRGLFQQRDNGAWGSYSDRMDPTISATNFYKALLRVEGWETMTPTQAAHATQRNADPNYYTQFWQDALAVFQALTGLDGVGSPTPGQVGEDCGPGGYPANSEVVFPLPAGSGYYDQRNFGRSSGRWASSHTGTDLSVGCGTPVLAATSGRIVIRTDQAWSGRWLVQVKTGPGSLATWYAHMQSINVTDGQAVAAGTQIGAVGTLGNSTGCHLHFEVHPRDGGYQDDEVDPSAWLAQHVGKQS